MNYSRTKFIKELSNTATGEIKYYQEVKGFKRTAAKGWRMTYTSYLEEVLCELNGKKKTQILFWIFDRFSKSNKEIPLSQKTIANKFETAQPYISKILNELIKMKVLLNIRINNGKKYYRLNPYLYIPAGANAIELQDEWDILIHAPAKVKDKFDYLYYLQSDEWKDKANICKEKAGNQCELCGSTLALECHHLSYDRLYEETPEDLQCLCKQCHKKIHEGE